MIQRSSRRSPRTRATKGASTTTPTETSGIECLERAYSLSLKEGWFARAETPPRERPPDLASDELSRLDPLERVRYDEARSVWHANIGPIHTPQMDAVLEDIDDIVQSNRQDGDKVKSSPVLDAYPGLGKSTLAVEYGAGFHRRQIELYGRTTSHGHQRVPVAYVTLTSNTSMKSLNSMLCRFYGHPGADRGNAERVGSMARQCVLECQTRLIIVDDIHFLNMHRHDGREVANHFKWLANQFPVTLFFVGVGLRQRGLLDEGLGVHNREMAQQKRRWTPFTLEPFEVGSEEGRQIWRRLLLRIERDLVLADKHQGMVVDEISDYLFARSTGHFQSLMSLIARGCRRAVRTGAERLTAELLDEVRVDEAAEQARTDLEAAIDSGLVTTRVRARRAG